MKKAIIITGLILGIFSCTQPKYFARTETELQQVNWKRNAVNYIPLTESDLMGSPILDTTYQFITHEEYAKLKQFLSDVETVSPDYFLAKALYHITKTDYERAMDAVKKVKAKQYEMLTNLLRIDLNYELNNEGIERIVADIKQVIEAQ